MLLVYSSTTLQTGYLSFSPSQGEHDGNLLVRWNHRFWDLNDYHNLERFFAKRVHPANGQYLPLFLSSLEATVTVCNDPSTTQTSWCLHHHPSITATFKNVKRLLLMHKEPPEQDGQRWESTRSPCSVIVFKHCSECAKNSGFVRMVLAEWCLPSTQHWKPVLVVVLEVAAHCLKPRDWGGLVPALTLEY